MLNMVNQQWCWPVSEKKFLLGIYRSRVSLPVDLTLDVTPGCNISFFAFKVRQCNYRG